MILGVSADADMSTIKEIAQRSLMELRLGGEEDPAAIRRIENALETLQDPVERFRWGLFWPELTANEAEMFRTDPVLSTLAANQCQDAAAAYERVSESDSIEVRSHNIGMLALLHAVAATEEAQKGTPDDIEDDLECVVIWEEALRHLRLVIGSDRFWMRQKLRAKSLGDARLDDARVDEIHRGLLSEILAPAGGVITIALLDGHAKVAKVYVELLRDSGFEEKFIDDTLSSVYKPLADRVERKIEQYKETLEEIAEESEDEEPFLELLESFEEGALDDLNVMLDVGDLPGYAEEHARDTAAEFLRSLGVASWNSTGEPTVSESAIQLAMRFADAASLKSKANEDFLELKQIGAARADSEKLDPIREAIKRSLQQRRLKEALTHIDALLTETTVAEEKANLKSLRAKVSSGVATDLYNQAITRGNARDFAGASRLLKEALKYETDQHERRIITATQSQLSQVSQSSTGCLVFLLTLVAATVLVGTIGGTLYAYIS